MNSPSFVLGNDIFWLSLPLYSDSKLGGSGFWLLSGSLQTVRSHLNLPAFPYCGRTSCSPSRVPQRSETEALFLNLGSMHLVLNKKNNLTKPSSPHACILFLDITNGGWGLSGCDLLCNRWSFNVLWVTEWDGGFCAAAHACAVMMNECLVCCVYGAFMRRGHGKVIIPNSHCHFQCRSSYLFADGHVRCARQST